MNRLEDEAAYFGAVQDGVDSQQELIESLKQQLAELADKVREECAQVCKDLADGAREARNLNIRRHGYSGDPAIMMQAYAYAEAAIRATKERP